MQVELTDRDIAQLDRMISRQLDAILHQERLRRLEGSWRGLAWLVDGFVQECPQRVRDSAVIVALNDGYDASDGALFSPTSKEVANTVLSYNGMFCSEYSINSADYSKGLPGVLYGRYQVLYVTQ